jgi:hypothetical protein
MGLPSPQDQPRGGTPRPAGGTAARLTFWTINQAPVADQAERSILQCLAKHADPDGANSWPSVPTMAEFAHVSERTVQRRLRDMEERRLIAPDTGPPPPQWLALPPGRRPPRWVILMPWSAWGAKHLPVINEWRAALGRGYITPESRPAVAAPPPRTRRADTGLPCPNRRRKATRAAEQMAAATAHEQPPPPPEPVDVEPVDEQRQPVVEAFAEASPERVDDGGWGVSQTPQGVTQRLPGGDSKTPNLSTADLQADLSRSAPLPLGDKCPKSLADRMAKTSPPAVGDQPQVVRGRARSADAGRPSKRSRGEATPRRPRRRPIFLVSKDAVEVYRTLPPQITAHIPDHAVGRVLHAITGELERLASALACHDPAELVRQMAERAEGWRYRMVDAEDPVAVVTALIVRGPRHDHVRPWCGLCEGPTPARRYRTSAGGLPLQCPDCHPALAPPGPDGEPSPGGAGVRGGLAG